MPIDALSRELLCLLLTVAVLGGYEWTHLRERRRAPARSARERNARMRAAWVRSMMASQSNGILAVQTLRNAVMAASFMATTAALIITGSLGFGAEANRLAAAWHAGLGLSFDASLAPFKIVALIAVFLASFLNFALSIRLHQHVGFAITMPADPSIGHDAEGVIADLNRAGALYGGGLRIFLLGLPVIAWLFDGVLMTLAAVVLVLVRRRLDRHAVAVS